VLSSGYLGSIRLLAAFEVMNGGFLVVYSLFSVSAPQASTSRDLAACTGCMYGTTNHSLEYLLAATLRVQTELSFHMILLPVQVVSVPYGRLTEQEIRKPR
jgi:hypothetical protein